MTMIEKVARALAECAWDDLQKDLMFVASWEKEGRQEYIDIRWKHLRPDAKAAIEAMRELTPKMVEGGLGLYDDDESPDFVAAYVAMIDAALEENDD